MQSSGGTTEKGSPGNAAYNTKMLLFLESLLHFPTRTVLIFNSSSCSIVGKPFTNP